MPLGYRGFATVLVVVASATWAGPAAANEPRSAVVVAEGPDADALVANVGSRLHGRYVARDARDFRAALGGASSFLAAGLKSARADGELVARARAAAVDAHVDFAILIHVRKMRHASVVHVWVIGASPGAGASVDMDVALGAGASMGDEADGVWNAVAGALPGDASTSAPPVASESPPSSPPTSSRPLASPAEVTEDGRVSGPNADVVAQPIAADSDRPLLRVIVAIVGASRHFAYVDRLSPTLRPYDLFAAPLAALRVEASPFAHSNNPGIDGLGLAGEYARAFGLSSADAGGTSVSTTWQSFRADVRDRFAIGRAVLAGAHGGFGGIDFSFGNALGSGAQLPSVGYRFMRAGLDGLLTLRDFSVYADASYLGVLSAGAEGTLFPRESVGGVDARAGLLWPINRHLDLSLELAYTRFFYALRPEPGDVYVAGGALDEIVGASLGLGYRM